MEILSLSRIACAVNGSLNDKKYGTLNAHGVSTDSREDLKNLLFIPIKGPRFDGHSYISEAFKKGAVCALTENKGIYDNPVIFVNDTKKALRDLAEYYISLFDIPVVAVTGSAGKTTTKDLIHSVLSVKYKTLKNQGNLNNEIGLPNTVFGLDSTYKAAVLEMGMSSFGEISRLSKIAKPRISVITNIGHAHIEALGSREGIFKAKCEIFDYMSENGKILVNADDDMLITLTESERKNVLSYGINNTASYYPSMISEKGLRGTQFTVNSPVNSFGVSIAVPGKHMIYNVLAAAAVGEALGLTGDEIAEGIAGYKSSAMRMDIFTAQNGITIINDAYNANPASMRAAIDVLSSSGTRNVCIIGDMFELGEFTEKLHYETGAYALYKNIDIIICVGQYAKHMYRGTVSESGYSKSYYFEDKNKLFEQLNNILRPNDTILIKASRGMGFEEIVKNIH